MDHTLSSLLSTVTTIQLNYQMAILLVAALCSRTRRFPDLLQKFHWTHANQRSSQRKHSPDISHLRAPVTKPVLHISRSSGSCLDWYFMKYTRASSLISLAECPEPTQRLLKWTVPLLCLSGDKFSYWIVNKVLHLIHPQGWLTHDSLGSIIWEK